MGIRLQDSAFLSEVAVNHLKKARSEIWPKRSEEETTHTKKKNYQDEDKKSAKKKINSQIKKTHLRMVPIEDNKSDVFYFAIKILSLYLFFFYIETIHL